MTWIEKETKESKVVKGIFITVWRDKSGGYFSRADMKAKSLDELVEDKEIKRQLNHEYDMMIKWTHPMRKQYDKERTFRRNG